MDRTELALERAKAERKSPAVLWLLNLVWPGLGNMVIGQAGTGILFGLFHWICIFLTIATLGLGSFLCFGNWLVACAVGHSLINRSFADSLRRIESDAGRPEI